MEPKFQRGDKVRLTHSPQSIYIVIGKSFTTDKNGNMVEEGNRYWVLSAVEPRLPIHEHDEKELELVN